MQRLAFLGGLALLIEGGGTQPTRETGSGAPPADPMVVHDALAVLTYDTAARHYAFRAYHSNGGAANAVDAVVSHRDGQTWWSFLQMTLQGQAEEE